jgi:hypothetical protein
LGIGHSALGSHLELQYQPIRDDLRTRVALERGERFIHRGVGAGRTAAVEGPRQRREFGLEIAVADQASVAAGGQYPDVAQQRSERAQARGQLFPLASRRALPGRDVSRRVEPPPGISGARRVIEQTLRTLARVDEVGGLRLQGAADAAFRIDGNRALAAVRRESTRRARRSMPTAAPRAS